MRVLSPLPLPRPGAIVRAALLALCLCPSARADIPGLAGVGVFELPGLAAARAEVGRLFQRGATDLAAEALQALIKAHPRAAILPGDMAQLRAALGQDRAAVEALTAAADLGLDIAPLLALPGFRAVAARLGGDPALQALRNRPAPPAPADPPKPVAFPVQDGIAPIHAGNTVWDSESGLLEVRIDWPPMPRDLGVIRDDKGPVSRLLQLWFAKGEAAGNWGDLYDNRDAGHSPLDGRALPQVTRTVYGPEAVAAGVHYGPNSQFTFGAITFGNSSTAVAGGAYWRSQPRLMLTRPFGAGQLYRAYALNQIYVYPEHRDHDPGNGDMLPANTPYAVISQGSSGSDRPFLVAIGTILAALKPKTKAFAREHGLIAPLVQSLLRRGMKAVRKQEDYFTAPAHPSVFEGGDIALERMVRLAQEVEPGAVPPMVQLRVIEESQPVPRAEIFGDGMGETLFDTPSAIGRVVQGTAGIRRMVVSAGDTRDPNDRALTFRWVVLRGDASRIGIRPLDERGAEVELTLPWHDRAAVPGRPDLTSDRVDIGVFALNGAQPSAPGFVSVFYPGDQRRIYDGEGRAQSIDYDAIGTDLASIDPLLFPLRDWRDDYAYDDQGRLTGWTRARGAEVSRFTATGLRVLEVDAQGRPVLAEEVAYPLAERPDGRRVVAETPTGAKYVLDYAGPGDLVGTPRALAVQP